VEAMQTFIGTLADGIRFQKETFKWKDEQQKAFETIQKVMGWETLLSFPNFAKPAFNIHADASDYQFSTRLCDM
jgi:hypothetical protein